MLKFICLLFFLQIFTVSFSYAEEKEPLKFSFKTQEFSEKLTQQMIHHVLEGFKDGFSRICPNPWTKTVQAVCSDGNMKHYEINETKVRDLFLKNLSTLFDDELGSDNNLNLATQKCLNASNALWVKSEDNPLVELEKKITSLSPAEGYEHFKKEFYRLSELKEGDLPDGMEKVCMGSFPFIEDLILPALVFRYNILKDDEKVNMLKEICPKGKFSEQGAKSQIELSMKFFYERNGRFGDIRPALKGVFSTDKSYFYEDTDMHTYEIDLKIYKLMKERTGVECPKASSPKVEQHVRCACLLKKIKSNAMSVPPIKDIESRIDKIENQAQKDYNHSIQSSKLSPAVKDKLIGLEFPKLSVSMSLSLNAFYIPGMNVFGITFPGLILGDDWTQSVMKHEIGHYFEAMLERDDVQSLLTDEDVDVLTKFRDCIDQNIYKGEVAIDGLRGSVIRDQSQIVKKRGEYLSDYFWRFNNRKKALKEQEWENEKRTIAFLCGDGSDDDDQKGGLFGDFFDPHADFRYRVPMLVNGFEKLRGMRLGVKKPKACEAELFNL